MAKVSPVSIKYMIHAKFTAEGALEKPDVIGAIFGQTEGLLGNELEMRELQKEGKIGRIEVDLERKDKMTVGNIQIPTALDQSETTLIAAAIETIERIGPSDAQIEIERIEDVRGSKRDYIIERAKKLMQSIEGSTDSREISNQIKDSSKIAGMQEYGDEKLPCGDLSGNEIVVVEGRADVINLVRNGVRNVIGMNGTKLPDSIRVLGKEKELTLFVDGDRGGKLIIQNVTDNANIKYIAIAPDGKEVEELTGKEILMNLRKKITTEEFLSNSRRSYNNSENYRGYFRDNRDNRERRYEYKEPREERENSTPEEVVKEPAEKRILTSEEKQKLRELSRKNQGTGKAILLNGKLEEVRSVSLRSLNATLRRLGEKPFAVVIDGTVTAPIIGAIEESEAQVIVAKNFATTETSLDLLSF